MAYNYDKSALKGLGVGAFLGEVKTRNAKIAEAPDTMPESIFNSNRLAAALHPKAQYAVVSKVIDRGDAKSFVLVPDKEQGTEKLAYFRAGQFVSVLLRISELAVSKPYSLQSGPKDALGEWSSYTITVRSSRSGFASEYILTNWKEGSHVTLSGPLGNFYYTDLRDAKKVVALAGGSGITPFFSMASAIVDGIEDFDLTILYGSRTEDTILLKDELESLCVRSKGRVKLVHVLSDEEREGYEHGFLTAELIRKYAPEGDYSIFLCGPGAFYDYMDTQLPALEKPIRRVRRELYGERKTPETLPDYPAEAAGKTFTLRVKDKTKSYELTCRAGQSLLNAMELSGIHAPADCRSGECGWCHSRLISGEVYVPEAADGRRSADVKFGWVHPCCTFPLSDVELEIFTLY